MQTMFLTQFQATVKYAPPVTTLANIKQKEGETLHAYFKRFNAESSNVRGATDETLKSLWWLVLGWERTHGSIYKATTLSPWQIFTPGPRHTRTWNNPWLRVGRMSGVLLKLDRREETDPQVRNKEGGDAILIKSIQLTGGTTLPLETMKRKETAGLC